ncbi:hypothetical protein JVU11DRAFT_7459 [Chiua virens]|nr:hypothetical protein JVU11DRAFT_7459 [Chiua virens]
MPSSDRSSSQTHNVPSTHGVSKMQRHEDFYLRDGNICFMVENTVFRLHRYFFERESKYFQQLLNPTGAGEDGSPDSPYTIRDVTSDEFAQLVWVWYNPGYSFSRKGKEHWLTVLRLATKWEFPEIRNLAIRQLERLDIEPVEKVFIYKCYDVSSELLLPSYVSLCRRKSLPSPEEGRILTMETILRLASAREQVVLAAAERGCATPATATAPEDIVVAVVAEQFALTLYSNDSPVGIQGQSMNGGNPLGKHPVDTDVVSVKQPDPNFEERKAERRSVAKRCRWQQIQHPQRQKITA